MAKKSASIFTTILRASHQQRRTATRLLKSLAKPPPKPKPAKPSEPPAPGAWLPLHHAAAGIHLRAWLYLPASVQANAPLLVMLHGCDQTAADFAQGTRMNQAAEKAGYAVLYPQQSASRHPHRCWRWYERAVQQGEGEAAALAALVKTVLATYPFDAARVYIAGISAGAAMANIVALHHPALFAALGMHSGPVFGAGHSAVGALGVMQRGASARAQRAIEEVMQGRPANAMLPTILIHGDDDAVVRPVNQQQLAGQALLVNGVADDNVAKVTQKAATRRTLAYRVEDVRRGRKLLLRVVRIAGLQHAWSGGDPRLKFNSAPGPDASRLLLDFFSKHRR